MASDFVRIDLAAATLVLDCRAPLPVCAHWGARLGDEEDLVAFCDARERPLAGGSLDITPPLSLLPETLLGWSGQPGLQIAGFAPRFNQRIHADKRSDGGIEAEAYDNRHKITLRFRIDLCPGDVLRLSTQIINRADKALHILHLAAPVLPAPDHTSDMMDFAGRWCGEFQPQRSPWQMGAHVREGREGRTGHAEFPALVVPSDFASNASGEVWAWHFGWHGGHRLIAEEVLDGRRQVQFAQSIGSKGLVLAPGETHETPPLYVTYSDQGFNGVLHALHTCVRQQIIKRAVPERPRPVHFNSWEATYYRHELSELKEIATRAASLGAERFVLDDGWFVGRRDDRRALGDWRVDPEKFPKGLGPIIEHVIDVGMEFGLWVEPEMVSPESQLYRQHPDWLHGEPIEQQPAGRNQYVLDLGRTDVRDYLFDALDQLLANYPIAYLKWDHNRRLIDSGIEQSKGFLELLRRLREAHPRVEFESCAAGGGRIDYGILELAERVWLSDSNDALERLRMQHHSALFLPPEVTGAHVGPRRSHTTHRVHSMRFRAWVAAQRHMGIEADPRDLDDGEATVLKRIVAWWKANRAWLLNGRLYRLDAADPALTAEMTIAEDGGQFVVFAGQARSSKQSSSRPLRLQGLDPKARYRVRQADGDELRISETRGWANYLEGDDGIVLSGAALMHAGLVLPLAAPESMLVIAGRREPDG